MTDEYKGTDRDLIGIVLAVITFWLFAQTTLNVGPVMASSLNMHQTVMNIAIAAAALFCGMFVVVFGGLADRFGRKGSVTIGNALNIVGSLLIAGAIAGPLAAPMMIGGRVLQGFAAACIMPASLALVKTYWQGKDRQRAVSIWSIGSWGGGGVCSIFGGIMASSPLGWRSIFVLCAASSIISMVLMRHIPESAPAAKIHGPMDWIGIVSFAIAMVSIQVVLTQGSALGWGSVTIIGLAVLFLCAFAIFVRTERLIRWPFVDFSLFRNRAFTGATISNFLLNATSGILAVSLWVMQDAFTLSTAQSGFLTVGYAVFVVGFIRVGEKFLQRTGPRFPMILGALIVLLSIFLLMFTNIYRGQYLVLAVVAYSLYGLGLAFYATPSTDTALSSLPALEAGAGAGIYKMASSLGVAFGAAISTSIFTALTANGARWLESFIPFLGTQDNVAIREAGMIGLLANFIMGLVALGSIIAFVPRIDPEAAIEGLEQSEGALERTQAR